MDVVDGAPESVRTGADASSGVGAELGVGTHVML